MADDHLAGEERILRKAMLWLFSLSVLASPRTFAMAPVDVPVTLVLAHSVLLVVLLVLLAARRVRASFVAGGAAAVMAIVSVVVFTLAIEEVVAGRLSTEAAGNMIMPAIVPIAGIAFIALRVRTAIAMTIGLVVAQVGVILAVAGPQAAALLSDRGILPAFRFSMTAIILFLVATTLSGARARERDIAERDRRTLQSHAQRLELEAGLRKQLREEAAHEIKGPLTLIAGAAETLRKRGSELTAEQTESLQGALMTGVERLKLRVEDVLENEPEHRFAEAELLVIDDVIKQLVAGMSPTSVPDGLELRCSSGQRVRIARAELEHVLENLLSNAVKYGGPGGTSLTTAAGADEVVVEVLSRGSQLTEDEAARVFDRHFRASAHGPVEGEGIGLALVRRVVAEWGGRVWCRVGDGGTTFCFTIPTAVVRSDDLVRA